jgi:hypothetical protein
LAAFSIIGAIEQTARSQLIGASFGKERTQLIHSRSELIGVAVGVGIYLLEQFKIEMLTQLFILTVTSIAAGMIFSKTFRSSSYLLKSEEQKF